MESSVSFEAKVATYFVAIFGCLFAMLIFKKRIPQKQTFHDFADKRTILFIPNFMDVVTNLAFLVVGLGGFYICYHAGDEKYLYSWERFLFCFFYLGISSVCFGSGYFHWTPNDSTLYWDRFSMCFCLATYFAILLLERFYHRFPWMIWLFPLLNISAIASITLWIIGEKKGKGDKRFYIWTQFAPIISMPFLVYFFPVPRRSSWPLWGLEILYFLAKVFEKKDKKFFLITGGVISGHSVKHLLAALGVALFVFYVMQ